MPLYGQEVKNGQTVCAERDYSLTLLVTAGHAYVQNGQRMVK